MTLGDSGFGNGDFVLDNDRDPDDDEIQPPADLYANDDLDGEQDP